jgi:hypothetical protein
MAASPPAGDRSWYIVGRWQEYEGEARANLFRIVGIAAFYLVELANHHGLRLGVFELPAVRPRAFHLAMTALAVAWAMLALGVQLCLRNRVFPASLKFLSTAGDLLLLTCLLCVAEGPRSPAVAAYFAVLALAALRLNVPLMRAATAGAVGGYLFLLGRAHWFAGADVPRYHQAIVLICLGLTGASLTHVVRRVRGMAEDYARRVAPPPPGRLP